MDRPTSQKPSALMDLLTGIAADARALLRQEAQLLRDEIKLEVSKGTRAVSGFGIGAVCAAVGGLFFLLMIVHGLHEWTGLGLWASYGVVGLILALTGVWLIARARSLAGTVDAMPRRSIYAMKENVQWIKEQMQLKKT